MTQDLLKYMVDKAGWVTECSKESDGKKHLLIYPKGKEHELSIYTEKEWRTENDRDCPYLHEQSLWDYLYYPLLLTRACEGLGIIVSKDNDVWVSRTSGKGWVAVFDTPDQAKLAGIKAMKEAGE